MSLSDLLQNKISGSKIKNRRNFTLKEGNCLTDNNYKIMVFEVSFHTLIPGGASSSLSLEYFVGHGKEWGYSYQTTRS